jgi:O-antigen ligase
MKLTRADMVFCGMILAIAFGFAGAKMFVPLLLSIIILVGAARLKWRKPVTTTIVLSGWYAMYLLGMLWAEDPASSAKFLEYKASLLVLPLLFSLAPRQVIGAQKWIMTAFGIGVLAFDLFALVAGFIKFLPESSWQELSYKRLASHFHPTYLAVYNVFAWAWCMLTLDRSKKLEHAFKLALLVISSLFVGMLASRAGLLSMGVVLVFFLVRHFVQMDHRKIVLTVVSAVLFTGTLFLPATAKRVDSAIRTGTEQVQVEVKKEKALTSSQVRIVTWKNSVQLMLAHPFGVGTGDVTNELVKRYVAQGEETAADHQLNSHNQYLQVGVELGWLGLLVMLFSMVPLARIVWQKRLVLPGVFLFLCAFNMLFESFIELQTGITFFCFFLTFFIWEETNHA